MTAQATGQTQGTTEEKVQASEKRRTEQAAAVTGAQAVADAVSKVAAAAVDAARSQSTGDDLDFVTSGAPGGTFHLRAKTGPIFSDSGSVFVNGKPQKTLEWGATYIRGVLDADVKSGEVTVPIDAQTVRRGYLKV